MVKPFMRLGPSPLGQPKVRRLACHTLCPGLLGLRHYFYYEPFAWHRKRAVFFLANRADSPSTIAERASRIASNPGSRLVCMNSHTRPRGTGAISTVGRSTIPNLTNTTVFLPFWLRQYRVSLRKHAAVCVPLQRVPSELK